MLKVVLNSEKPGALLEELVPFCDLVEEKDLRRLDGAFYWTNGKLIC
jgi:hypothetical protein